MTVREVLEAAREAAIQLRRLDEEAEIRREAIGPQGYSMGPHAKVGILDPMRHVDELLDWEQAQKSFPDLTLPLDEAWDVVSGIATISDELTLDMVSRYYLQGEPWTSIARDYGDKRGINDLVGLSRAKQVERLQGVMDESFKVWEHIGIAHLKEMGRA